MIYTKDVHYKVGQAMSKNGYLDMNIEQKKQLTIEQLKIYIISKLSELNEIDQEVYKKLDITEVFKVLFNIIPREQHHDVLSQIIHCLLNITSTIQGYEIVWWQQKDEDLIDNSVADFNEFGYWDCIRTHENTDYDKIFNFIYDVFINQFAKKMNVNKIV